MFNSVLDWILELIKKFGLGGVFVGSFIEELIAPIPSPLVMMSAGAGLLSKYNSVTGEFVIDLGTIAFVGAIGALLGSYVPYYVAYYGGKPMIEKTSKLTGVKWSFVEKIKEKMNKSKSDEITLLSLRAIPVMPSVLIAVTAGLIRMKFITYSIIFGIGGFIRNVIFLVVGWQLGTAYVDGAHKFESASDFVQYAILIIMIGILGYLYWKRTQVEKDLDKDLDSE